jgi:hypothetical protein
MSPEQARNAKTVDTRTDIWSLCMSMYEALSGGRPWSHCTTVGELILAICTEELAPLARVAPWVDPALAAVVERGLERQAAKRWLTVDELYRALAPFTKGSDEISRSALVGVPIEERWKSVQQMVDTGATTIAAGAVSGGGELGASTLGANSIPAAETVRRPKQTGTGMIVGATAAAMLLGATGIAFVTRTHWLPTAAVSEPPKAAAVIVPGPVPSPSPVAAPSPSPSPSVATAPTLAASETPPVPSAASAKTAAASRTAKRPGVARPATAAAGATKPTVAASPAVAATPATPVVKPAAPSLQKDW